MVFFFTVTLVLSLCAMALLLAVKRYELTTGRVMLASMRPGASSFFEKLSQWGRKILPSLVRQYVERAVQIVLTKLQLWLAKIILSLEHSLERVLHTVRERTGDGDVDREPSAFLREVADHKKNLSYKKDVKKVE